MFVRKSREKYRIDFDEIMYEGMSWLVWYRILFSLRERQQNPLAEASIY